MHLTAVHWLRNRYQPVDSHDPAATIHSRDNGGPNDVNGGLRLRSRRGVPLAARSGVRSVERELRRINHGLSSRRFHGGSPNVAIHRASSARPSSVVRYQIVSVRPATRAAFARALTRQLVC